VKAIDDFDYLVINEQLEEAVRMFSGIILAARARERRDFRGTPLPTKVLNV
jgi:guanylate kinase